MATVAGATTPGLMELEMLLLVIMIGTFASTAVAVGQGVTLHIVVAAGGVEGSTDTASGPIASRCHNVQLPDRSRRLLVVNRANAADDRRRDLRFSITFCSYDCTMVLLLVVLLLLTVTLVITATRASLGPGGQIPLLLIPVILAFRGILLAGLCALRVVASCRWCACSRSLRRRRCLRTAA